MTFSFKIPLACVNVLPDVNLRSLLILTFNFSCFSFRNPVGRTGISGRGLLGKWGPNHAADPLVTRYEFSVNIYLKTLH